MNKNDKCGVNGFLVTDDVATRSKEKLSELQISTAMSCATCGIVFDSRQEQVLGGGGRGQWPHMGKVS